METLNIRGDFDSGLNLLGPIETMKERYAAADQAIWIELENLFQ